MKQWNQMLCSVAAGLCLLAAGQSAHAAFMNGLIGVDFNANGTTTYTGAGVVGAGGDVWNGIGDGGGSSGVSKTNVSLKDSAGSATDAMVSYSAQGSYNSSSYSPTGGVAPDLIRDFLYEKRTGSVSTITLSGLDAATTYDLYVYGASADRAFDLALTITGQSVQTGGFQNQKAQPATFVEGRNYAAFTLMPDSAGQINIGFAMASGTTAEVDISGLQIQAVPEPGVVSLLAVGGLLALRRRERKAL